VAPSLSKYTWRGYAWQKGEIKKWQNRQGLLASLVIPGKVGVKQKTRHFVPVF
jgi:hypothetical protein